jgi:hypothetical protein
MDFQKLNIQSTNPKSKEAIVKLQALLLEIEKRDISDSILTQINEQVEKANELQVESAKFRRQLKKIKPRLLKS